MNDIQLISDNQGLEVSIPQTLADRPVAIYLLRCAENSRLTIMGGLTTALRTVFRDEGLTRNDMLEFPWEKLEVNQMVSLQRLLLDRVKPITVISYMTYVRGVLKVSWQMDYITHEKYQKLITSLPRIDNSQSKASRGRYIAPILFSALLDSLEGQSHFVRLRARAILALGYWAGMRREEIVSLRYEDYKNEDVKRRLELQHGTKRGKSRLVPVSDSLKLHLDNWLNLRGPGEGIMICPIDDRTHKYRNQLVYDTMMNVLRYADVEDQFSPHDLRHSCLTNLLIAGVDLFLVQKIAGHSEVATTSRYDQRPDDALFEAILTQDF